MEIHIHALIHSIIVLMPGLSASAQLSSRRLFVLMAEAGKVIKSHVHALFSYLYNALQLYSSTAISTTLRELRLKAEPKPNHSSI